MRTVPPERVLELIPVHARRVGLVGAAVTDHPRIVELVRAIAESGREVGISSLRADRLCARPSWFGCCGREAAGRSPPPPTARASGCARR